MAGRTKSAYKSFITFWYTGVREAAIKIIVTGGDKPVVYLDEILDLVQKS